MAWLEANRAMVISDYHACFVARFGRLDVSAANLHGLRKRKGWKVGRDGSRYKGRLRKYTEAEFAWLKANATLPAADYHAAFCARFGRTDTTAGQLTSLRKREGWKTGRDGCFPPGSVPPNKGKKGQHAPGCEKGWFAKGNRTGRANENYVPIGTEKVVADGYLSRKVNDDLPLHARWRFVHLIRWEEQHGPIPAGHCLKCLDGNRLNTDPANWVCVSRGVLPRLNGKSGRDYENAPAELKPTILATAQLEQRVSEIRKERANG